MDDTTVIPWKARPKPAIPDDRITRENFFARGLATIEATGQAAAFDLGSAEHEAWARYFDAHLRWRPWALSALERRQIEMLTMPTQWPEWFDTNYAAGA